MAIFFKRITTKNYRALADVTVELGDINVLFGPNGAGKSTFLDVLWFIRDCVVNGVDAASARRSHGIGVLFDGAAEGDPLVVTVETGSVGYELSLGLSSGRIEPYPGETLRSADSGVTYIERRVGSNKASFFDPKLGEHVASQIMTLREPEKLSLGRYLDVEPSAVDVAELDRRLRYIHLYPSRSLDLQAIKQRGSEQSHETWLWEGGQNLWSVLRNLQGKRAVDDRYKVIIAFMREGFPGFRDLVLEATGPTSTYGSFVEHGRKRPVFASGASDGHVQMLFLLTALFAEGKQRTSIMLLDEPELSLHPWALAVLGKAIKVAAQHHQKQVLVATHSPVLMSQFEPKDCLAVELTKGRTRLKRVSEIENIGDLLADYATGSLYMSEMIAPQSTMGEGADE
jgi:predicted ATPase